MIVFAGPSVAPRTRDLFPAVDWRPPAVAGDLQTLVDSAPAKVLLLDGLFEERAAVRHKEALELIAAGTRLYGAASMGALRAVELAPFGMIPLGRIAHAYRQGLLVGDDEVALVHGDDRIAWKPVSVAMVDARATLCRALREGVVGKHDARELRERWHDIHYVDRHWRAMEARADSLVGREISRKLSAMHVPLKELDARAALEFAAADPARGEIGTPPPRTWFTDRLLAGA